MSIGVGTAVGEDEGADEQHHEQRGHDETGFQRQLPPGGDPGHKAAVVGAVNEPGEAEQQAGHQGEHCQQAEHNGLHQHQSQVLANAELHKAHGAQAGEGGHGAAGDLRNGFAQGGHHGLPGLQVFPLLGIAVAEDDGVIDGQGQLQYHGHGVGHEGDLPKDEVGALVHQRRHAEGHQQHGDLHVGVGGEQQHQQYNDHGDDHDHLHLGGQIFGGRIAYVSSNVYVVTLQKGFDLFQGVGAHRAGSSAAVCNGEQGGTVVVVVLRAVKFHGFHSLNGPDLLRQEFRLRIGYVVYHNTAGAEGDKLLIHDGQALAGFGGVRQVAGQIVVDRHPAAGKDAEDGKSDVNEVKGLPFIHNKGGHPFQRTLLFRAVCCLLAQSQALLSKNYNTTIYHESSVSTR